MLFRMSPENPYFDWVAARYACTAARMFDKLKAAARRNLESRNAQLSAEERKFTFQEFPSEREPVFELRVVGAGNPADDPYVRFRLTNGTIHVEGTAVEDFTVEVAMDDGGQCVFLIGEPAESRLAWQVLHQALDRLFFRHHPAFG